MLGIDTSEVAKRVSRWSLALTGNAIVFSRSRFSALASVLLAARKAVPKNGGKLCAQELLR
jgi:hypothetical protein